MSEHALIVDRGGLAKKLNRRPKAFILYELLQNAWDEDGATEVHASATMLPGQPICEIIVMDDSPEGFTDLSSVYTLFRDSKKAPDPTKRGRFEMGEKLVLALAIEAELHTTKGSVVFRGKEFKRTTSTRDRRTCGTRFRATFRMTRDEHAELVRGVQLLAVPGGITTTFNGERLKPRMPVDSFETTLQTIRSDDEGNLGPTQRKTTVRLYSLREGETAHIYEMGIPVVETGDLYHYDVQQRVPVNWERSNVPPSFLRTLRVEVLNATHEDLTSTDARDTWVTDALDDTRCAPEAVGTVVKKRYGDRAVINDPSDPEGTKIAMSQGHTVIPGGAFSKSAWDNVRASGVVLPAGQVTPSPKPYSPEGDPEKVIETADWTARMAARAAFAKELFRRLTRAECFVVIVNEPSAYWSANFGPTPLSMGSRLCLNYGRLGKAWFARSNRDPAVLDLLLHEFVHHTVSDHLSAEMHKTATWLGARLANIALDDPHLFVDEGAALDRSAS